MTLEQAWTILMDDKEEWLRTGSDLETRQRYRSKMNRGKNIPMETKIEYVEKAGMTVDIQVYRKK